MDEPAWSRTTKVLRLREYSVEPATGPLGPGWPLGKTDAKGQARPLSLIPQEWSKTMNKTLSLSRRLLHTLVIVGAAFMMLIGTTGAAEAQIIDRQNDTFLVDEYGFAPYCVQNEAPFLHLTGTMHYMVEYVQDAEGTFHFTSTVNLQGVKGVPAILVGTEFVDITTGPTWVSTSAFSATSSNTWPPGSPVTFTQISRSVLVSQGAEPNLLTTFTIRTTINANGVTTVNVFAGVAVCRG